MISLQGGVLMGRPWSAISNRLKEVHGWVVTVLDQVT